MMAHKRISTLLTTPSFDLANPDTLSRACPVSSGSGMLLSAKMEGISFLAIEDQHVQLSFAVSAAGLFHNRPQRSASDTNLCVVCFLSKLETCNAKSKSDPLDYSMNGFASFTIKPKKLVNALAMSVCAVKHRLTLMPVALTQSSI